MRVPNDNHKSTALIRVIKGRITVLGTSGGFPFPLEALPREGATCPPGTGALAIFQGMAGEFRGAIPIERWIGEEYLDGGSYVLTEHSLLLPGQILTLLEIEVLDLGRRGCQ
ncbi:MAG: hypothetical protein HPY50_18075 [Firmicutes bacterium]|nr:hypothetical protein [Bacillota bacterium]